MTAKEVITTVNALNPNYFEEEIKGRLLAPLEANILHIFKGEGETYKYPQDMHTELYLPDRYADVYVFYLSAMICFHNGEYEQYNNHLAQYTELLTAFAKEFERKRTNRKKPFSNMY